MIIVGLDLGLSTGWAVGPIGGEPRFGTIDFRDAGDSLGARGASFIDWMYDRLEAWQPFRVVYEAPVPTQKGMNAARNSLGFGYSLEVVCYRLSAPVREVHNNTVRKWFVGSGRAEKWEVEGACRARGWEPPDNNAADALAVWAFACKLYAPQGK